MIMNANNEWFISMLKPGACGERRRGTTSSSPCSSRPTWSPARSCLGGDEDMKNNTNVCAPQTKSWSELTTVSHQPGSFLQVPADLHARRPQRSDHLQVPADRCSPTKVFGKKSKMSQNCSFRSRWPKWSGMWQKVYCYKSNWNWQKFIDRTA